MVQPRGNDILSLDQIKDEIESTINTELDYNSINDCSSFQAVIHQLNGWRDYLTERRKDIRELHNNIKKKLRESESTYKHQRNLAMISIKAGNKSLSTDIVKATAEVQVAEYEKVISTLKSAEENASAIEDYVKDVDRRLSDMSTSARKTADFLRDELARTGQNRKY